MDDVHLEELFLLTGPCHPGISVLHQKMHEPGDILGLVKDHRTVFRDRAQQLVLNCLCYHRLVLAPHAISVGGDHVSLLLSPHFR